MDNSFQILRLQENYEIKVSQPKVVNTQIFYQDTNQEYVKKLRKDNLFYPCRNIQTNQNISAQLIYLETYKIPEKEIAVLDLLCKYPHTNIIKIFNIVKKDHCYVMQEDITLNLEDFIKTRSQLTTEIKSNLFIQLVIGFKHLKFHKIILRDLQPKHIFVQIIKTIKQEEYILKISDFRSAEISENGKVSSLNGMSDFAAPETLIKDESLTNSCCVYTLGMLLYYICNDGKKPFQATSYQDLIKKQKEFCQTLSIEQYSGKDDFKLRQIYYDLLTYDKDKRSQTCYDCYSQDYYLLENLYFLRKSCQVGQGQQGLVVDAFNIEKEDTLLVCKMIPKNNQYNDKDLREVQVCEHLEGEHHQNIIKIIKIIKDSQWYFIILEKCEMNVRQYMIDNQNSFTDLQIIDFLLQIISGYTFLKQRSIVHRDLKPENIMIKFDNNDDKIYKIIDFGVSKIVSCFDLAQTDVGSLLYTAPEVLENEDSYTNQCDIFSLGVLLFYMMYKKEYIRAKDRAEIMQLHQLLKSNPFKCPDSMRNPHIIQLIEKMIVYDPVKRINWEQLKSYKLSRYYQDTLNEIYFFLLFALKSEQLLFEFQDMNKDNQLLTGDIYAHRIILLKFAKVTFQEIEQSFKSNSISIDNEIVYKNIQKFNINQWKINNKWDESYQLLQQGQLRLDKEQITIIDDALNVIESMKIKDSEITQNFRQVHKFYIKLPNLLKNPIILESDLIKLKYHLLKMRNLFNDFIQYYILGQGSKIVFYDKMTETQMKEYINSNQ